MLSCKVLGYMQDSYWMKRRNVWWISKFFSESDGTIKTIWKCHRIPPPEFNVVLVELLRSTRQSRRLCRFPDRRPTGIQLTVALRPLHSKHPAPRHDWALPMQSLPYELLQELKNALFTKMAGEHGSMRWNLLYCTFQRTDKWKHSIGMMWTNA